MNSDAAFFSDVDTATLGDASTALGLNLIMEGPTPSTPETRPRFAGPAATMVFAPVRDPGAKALFSLYDAVEEVPAGSVVVVDAAGSPLAVWGGGASSVCKRRGAVGCVIDGATRDLEALRDLDFPVFSKSVWSLAFPMRLGSRGERRSHNLLRGARGAWGHRRRGPGRRGRRSAKLYGASEAAGHPDSGD